MSASEDKIILWHSTSLLNKDAILKNGIICIPLTKNKAKEELKIFHDAVSKELGVEFRNKHYTLERMLQASENGCVVYLSDEKEYSMQNALASQEWKIDVIYAALKKKFPREYKKLENLRAYYCRASRRWRNQEKKEMEGLPDYGIERRKIICENLRLYNLRNEANERLADYARIMRDTENKYHELFFSNECITFKVELPWNNFLSLYRDRKEKLERRDFHEICLTNVPLRHIVSVEEFNMEEWERARRSGERSNM